MLLSILFEKQCCQISNADFFLGRTGHENMVSNTKLYICNLFFVFGFFELVDFVGDNNNIFLSSFKSVEHVHVKVRRAEFGINNQDDVFLFIFRTKKIPVNHFLKFFANTRRNANKTISRKVYKIESFVDKKYVHFLGASWVGTGDSQVFLVCESVNKTGFSSVLAANKGNLGNTV